VWKAVRPWIAVVLVTFLLAELMVRGFHHFYPGLIFKDRSYNQYRGRPGAIDYDFRLNSQGFKDLEFNMAKSRGVHRIVALGDSFAFGVVPYRNHYLTLLEEALGATAPVEVYNMGINGIGPVQYLSLLENEGLRYRPDTVLLSFFIGNDFTDTIPREEHLIEYSGLLTFIDYLIKLSTSFEGRVMAGDIQYQDSAPTFTDKVFLEIEARRAAIYRTGEIDRKIFDQTVSQLLEMRDRCARRGAALKVVIIPDELQVDPGLQGKVLRALKGSSADYDFRLPNRYLAHRLAELGIDHLDLTEVFATATRKDRLYKPNDTHWNIAGNALASGQIAQWLRQPKGQ
jgi:hypothetical protein